MKIGNVAVTLFLVLAAQALGQDQTFFSEVVEVRVTNVDVVVTGRDGKPVTGLTRDDFEIYENGVRQELTNFFEIRESGGPSLTEVAAGTAPLSAKEDLQRRDITIFIDNAVLHPLRRNQILPQLRRFVERNVRAGDSVAIVTWHRSLKMHLEPTADRAAIDVALKGLESQVTGSSLDTNEKDEFYRRIAMLQRMWAGLPPDADGKPQKPPWYQAVNEARAYAMGAVHGMRQRIEAIKSVVAWRRGVEGRKVLVLLTGELPMNPAEEPFLYLDSMRTEFADSNSPAMAEALQYEQRAVVHEIADAANSSGVTLYPIDTAGKESGSIARDAASTPRITARGSVEHAAAMPTLRMMAEDTGGYALTGSDNWQLAFDTISNDLGTYYSLGYRSAGDRVDRTKKIEVRLKNKRYAVRTRRAVVEKSLASEMHDAVASNLFRAAARNDLSIRAVAGAAVPKDTLTVV
ncbi:MAG TPA: VWA domain-containing protein, partial [Thermoanaerobaculia bacterium]|nr:VWA domain-containing protein [Thermoanaerobaculia bacterium]